MSRSYGRYFVRVLAWMLILFAIVLVGAHTASAKKAVPQPIVYGTVAEEEWVTPYEATCPVSESTAILIHGGGFQAQPKETEMIARSKTLSKNCITVFTIDYPQLKNMGEESFPRIESAIERAVIWVQLHASEYGGNPNDIVIEGESAGGLLAGLTTERVNRVTPNTIRAVEVSSGPEDLYGFAQEILKGEVQFKVGTHKKHLERIFNCPNLAKSCLSESFGNEWSPAFNVDPETCVPWLIASNAEDEVPEHQQEEVKAALDNAGCSATLRVFPGKGHTPTLAGEGIKFLQDN